MASAACPVAFSTPSCAVLEALSITEREGQKLTDKQKAWKNAPWFNSYDGKGKCENVYSIRIQGYILPASSDKKWAAKALCSAPFQLGSLMIDPGCCLSRHWGWPGLTPGWTPALGAGGGGMHHQPAASSGRENKVLSALLPQVFSKGRQSLSTRLSAMHQTWWPGAGHWLWDICWWAHGATKGQIQRSFLSQGFCERPKLSLTAEDCHPERAHGTGGNGSCLLHVCSAAPSPVDLNLISHTFLAGICNLVDCILRSLSQWICCN